MRKTFHCIALALMSGVISFSSCTQAEIEGTQGIVVTPMFKTVISATTPGNPQTRINFEDEGGSGVALAWETGDMLVAYKGDTKAAVFHYTGGNGASSGTFEAQTSDELEGDYTLIYTTFSENAHESNIDKMRNKIKNRPVVQVGSGSTAHLKNNVLMEASYIVGESAAFSHKMALMTVNVKKPADNNLLSKVDKPIIMTLEEDYSTLYSLHLSGMDWNSEFKVYFFVEPRSSERRFEFTIHTNNGFYLSGAVKTGYTYTEGYRYTAILDENFFMSSGYINLYQLKGFCYCDLEGDIWVFSTRNSDNGDDDDWQRLRESIQFWSSPVTVIFPDIKILPEGAFDGGTNLTAVYSPLMEDYFKAYAFRIFSF